MPAQFPSICYIKGAYAAKSNLRINRGRLALSSHRIARPREIDSIQCCLGFCVASVECRFHAGLVSVNTAFLKCVSSLVSWS